MAGTITHSWNGTVLTITSDSGTSSCDLKGGKGDMGIRGPQGPAGVVVNEEGILVGAQGEQGKSAYDVACDNGFEGSQGQWLESLKGAAGKDGADGSVSFNDLTDEQKESLKGDDYVLTDGDKTDIATLVMDMLPLAEEARY